MTKREMEKKLEEYLNERYWLVIHSEPERVDLDSVYYRGVCAAVAQIGGWERQEDGKHFVKLNCNG